MDREKLHEFVAEKTGKCKVLVAGDVMVDKYYYGDVTRFSSEAPVPVAHIIKQKVSLGGAANIARNLSLLGCEASLAGFVGMDTNCEHLQEQLTLNGIDWQGLVYTNTPTTAKVRIMSGHHQMFRVDFEERAPREQEYTDKLQTFINNRLNESLDALILADFERGVCTEHFCKVIIKAAHAHGVPVVVNPYGQNWIKYSHADYVVPNVAKLNKILLTPVSTADNHQIERAGRYIMQKFGIKNALITRSEDGITLVKEGESVHIPTTKVQEVFDNAGASDAVIAVFAMALAGGLKPVDGAYLANLAAGIVISRSGTYAVRKDELLGLLEG
ncbi:MAG TPA: D-glycero-beta-D-manno-heptose-7-phosphate kinase [Selenomonas sp.]|nr:D-glycero-beta-D-manno-heptose-7-phosphate kinase [Selenomonadaceae bacterium]HCB92984.1 D-glycero-beta-D-manno-heptose-7-phosphate kinase [Selenomonas sp.]